MNEKGLWELFFATGLPQAYLAARGAEEKSPRQPAWEPAFHPADSEPGRGQEGAYAHHN